MKKIILFLFALAIASTVSAQSTMPLYVSDDLMADTTKSYVVVSSVVDESKLMFTCYGEKPSLFFVHDTPNKAEKRSIQIRFESNPLIEGTGNFISAERNGIELSPETLSIFRKNLTPKSMIFTIRDGSVTNKFYILQLTTELNKMSCWK